MEATIYLLIGIAFYFTLKSFIRVHFESEAEEYIFNGVVIFFWPLAIAALLFFFLLFAGQRIGRGDDDEI